MLKYSSLLALAAAEIVTLVDGPADFPKIIAEGKNYTDPVFTEDDVDRGEIVIYTEYPRDWERISEAFHDHPLFRDSNTTWINDIKTTIGSDDLQHQLSALGAIATNSAVVKDKFITQTWEKTGIYAIRLYIRGKPWVLTIDDYIMRLSQPRYIAVADDGPIWGVLLLKARAKAVGSYHWLGTKGTQANALKSFTGCPTFTLKTGDFDSARSLFSHLKDAIEAGYFVVITSRGGTLLDWSMKKNHYTLLAAMIFDNQADNTQEMLYIVRDPTGSFYDDSDNQWRYDSAKWTDEMMSQLPFGITLGKNGIIVLDEHTFYKVIGEFSVAHCREGYSSNWYDVELNLGLPTFLDFEVPAKDGDLYVSVDPFFSDLMAWATPSCFLLVNPGFKMGWDANPIIKLTEEDYYAGDSLSIMAWVTWWGFYSDASYTVNVYSKQDLTVVDWFGESNEIHMDGQEPSGFKKSTYRV